MSENAARFNEDYADYRKLNRQEMEPCPICGDEKPKMRKTCSRKCAAKLSGKVDWDSHDLEKMLKEMTIVQVADALGVSYAAVKKRLNKIHHSAPGARAGC